MPPPHCIDNISENYHQERKALKDRSIAGFDWIAICKMFRALQVTVFSFIPMYAKFPWYHLLGTVIRLWTTECASFISVGTIQLLLRLTGNQVICDPTIETFNINLFNWKDEQDAVNFWMGKISKRR
jgi:hypothetical protein